MSVSHPLMVHYASRSGVYGDGQALRLLVCQGLLFRASALLINRIFRGNWAFLHDVFRREVVSGVIGYDIDYEEWILAYQFIEHTVVELPFCGPTLP